MHPTECCFWTVLVAVACARCSPAQHVDLSLDLTDFQESSDLDTGARTSVSAMSGGVAELPCHVDPDSSHDVQRLVLWYRSGSGAPFYSYDTRGGRKGQGTHWASEDSLGQRSRFDPRGRAPLLRIRDVTPHDDGVYRCRADFKTSPTLNARVHLTVVEPPGEPVLLNETGHRVTSRAGPYHVGSAVRIDCQVDGGHPRPNVTWWRDGELLDDSWGHGAGNISSNTLSIERVERADLLRLYTCVVANSQLQEPYSVSLRLDVTFPPRRVQILDAKKLVLSAGRPANLTCEAVDSRPEPVILWYKEGELLPSGVLWTRPGNVTSSTVQLVPSAGDAGHVVRCRAFSPADPHTFLEDSLQLRVNYAPVPHITIGRSLLLSDIEEGDDVYFECNVDAFPPAERIGWRLNGQPVELNRPEGVMEINQSLVLQDVTQENAGLYTCHATNSEGTGVSEEVLLRVQYVPRCRPQQQTVFGAALHEEVRVPCGVDALPRRLTFRWSFNNTGDIVHLPAHQFTVNGTVSTASFTARSELHYGTLLCRAQNSAGLQREPCVFHIIPAAVPEPPTGCTSQNSSGGSMAVRCRPAAGGGLSQRFVLELRGSGDELLFKTSAGTPRFLVPVGHGHDLYQIMIYAENAKGRSKPLVMQTQSVRDAAERRTERIIDSSLKAPSEVTEQVAAVPSLALLLVAAGCGALLVAGLVLAVVLVRRRSASRRPSAAGAGPRPATEIQNGSGHSTHGAPSQPCYEQELATRELRPSGLCHVIRAEPPRDISYIRSPWAAPGGSATLPRAGPRHRHHCTRAGSPGYCERTPLRHGVALPRSVTSASVHRAPESVCLAAPPPPPPGCQCSQLPPPPPPPPPPSAPRPLDGGPWGRPSPAATRGRPAAARLRPEGRGESSV